MKTACWLLELLRAFVRRDFLFHWSYKLGFLYELGSLVSTVLTLYFVGRLFGDARPAALQPYGGDYFTFSLVGMAFLDYMWVSMRSFARQVHLAQLMGTLEAMMVSATHPFLLILGSACYTYLFATLRAIVYLLLGVLFFGVHLRLTALPTALFFVVLMVLAFSGLGLISAALTLYVKQSEPLTSLLGGVSFLFGGIVYPVQCLPPVLQKVAWLLPMTHAVEGIRQALLEGVSFAGLCDHASFLAGWAVVSFPAAFLTLRKVMDVLSREGSFGAY